MAKTMNDVIVERAADFGGTTRKGNKVNMSDVDISVWLKPDAPPVDKEQLREEEKHLQRHLKMHDDILKRWDPTLVADKARKKLDSERKELAKRLAKIRKQLG